jgi:hypothetical protein
MNQSAPVVSPLLAVCGLYCGACSHYRASLPQRKHLLEQAVRSGRIPEAYTCHGCRSAHLYVHPGCAQCQIRACAEAKGYLHCGQCQEFPCDRLISFRDDGHVHHLDVCDQLEQLNEKGVDLWLVEQGLLWTCTCGARFSWYEAHCQACGKDLESYFRNLDNTL